MLTLLLLLSLSQELFVVIPAPSGGGGACTDYTSSMMVLFEMEESSGNRANETDTVAGSDCVATDNNTVSSGAGIQGTNAADFERDNNEYFTVDVIGAADCDELETVFESSAYSVGMWINPESLTGNNGLWRIYDFTAGYFLSYAGQFDSPSYELEYAGSSGSATDSGQALVASTWQHTVVTWANDADDDILTYYDGVSVGTAGSNSTNITYVTSQLNYEISDQRSTYSLDGLVDEYFIIDVELTAEQVCYICSCGVDGSLCSGTAGSYTDSGRNSSNCGSCTLPSCTAGAP